MYSHLSVNSFVLELLSGADEPLSLARSLSFSLCRSDLSICFYADKIHLFLMPSGDWRQICHVPENTLWPLFLQPSRSSYYVSSFLRPHPPFPP